ncbi:S8 family serine peptidase [Streptomyces sp. NPDC023723]|uniref:S8 family serine peptidase n=1 Tax=Streptomyces sp. NPDC023723 TaxID=3154323 RepID=UPI0033E7CDD0
MSRTRTPRPRTAGALVAVGGAAALSATAPPARTAPEGRMLGAGAAGPVSGSCLVTLKGEVQAAPAAGQRLAEKRGAGISRLYGTVLNGYDGTSVFWATEVPAERTQRNPPSRGPDRVGQRSLPEPAPDRRRTAPASGGKGVPVHAIDTAGRTAHQGFGSRASRGYDFAGRDRTARDGDGHGTHAAATVAGPAYGVAGKARVVAVRVLDGDGAGTTARVVAGIDRVTRHARGPAGAHLGPRGPRDSRLGAAVRAPVASGVTHPVAAGNARRPAPGCSPAGLPTALTAGATDRTDTRALFANCGPAVGLFAPGVANTSASTSASRAGDTTRATASGTSTAPPRPAGHPRAGPAQVVKSRIAGAVSGQVSGRGTASPNRLPHIPRAQVPRTGPVRCARRHRSTRE